MKPSTYVMLIVGIFAIAIGLSAVSGAVTLSVAPPGTGPGVCPCGTAAFTVATANLTATVTTHNVLPSCTGVCSSGAVVTFGDGAKSFNSTSTHTYLLPGNYKIVDTVFLNFGATQQTVTANKTVTVPSTTNTTTDQATISPAFSYSSAGLVTDFTDRSVVVGTGLSVSSVTFNFGDAKTATGGSGYSINHTYMQSGTYAVQETVTGSDGKSYYTFHNVTVAPTQVTPSLTVGPIQSGNPASIPLGWGLVVFGLVFIVGAYVPFPSVYRIPAIVLVSVAIAALAYFGTGGPV